MMVAAEMLCGDCRGYPPHRQHVPTAAEILSINQFSFDDDFGVSSPSDPFVSSSIIGG